MTDPSVYAGAAPLALGIFVLAVFVIVGVGIFKGWRS